MAQKMVSASMHSIVLRKAPEGLTGFPEALYFMQAQWKSIGLLEPGTTKSVDPPEFAALGINREGVSVKQRRYWEMYTEDVTGARFELMDDAERARCRTLTNSEGEARIYYAPYLESPHVLLDKNLHLDARLPNKAVLGTMSTANFDLMENPEWDKVDPSFALCMYATRKVDPGYLVRLSPKVPEELKVPEDESSDRSFISEEGVSEWEEQDTGSGSRNPKKRVLPRRESRGISLSAKRAKLTRSSQDDPKEELLLDIAGKVSSLAENVGNPSGQVLQGFAGVCTEVAWNRDCLDANHGQVMTFLGGAHGETRTFLRDIAEGVTHVNFLLKQLVEHVQREAAFRAYSPVYQGPATPKYQPGEEAPSPLSEGRESKNPK